MSPESNKEKLLKNPFPLNSKSTNPSQPNKLIDPLHGMPEEPFSFISKQLSENPIGLNYKGVNSTIKKG